MASRKRKADGQVVLNFETMGLKPDLLRGIYSYGFEKSSTIQQRVIKQITKGNDLSVNTTYTAYREVDISISVLQSLDTETRQTQTLVLAPSLIRSVCLQKITLTLGDYMDVQCHACIGGTTVDKDIRKLDYGQHVVTGTPDRILDMIRSRNLRTSGIKLLVLDEADEMLSRNFKEHLYDIYRCLPPGVQVVLLSATLTHDVLEMTRKFMTEPVTIEGELDKEPDAETFSNYVMVNEKQLKKSKTREDVLKAFTASGTLNKMEAKTRLKDYYYKPRENVFLSRDFKMSIISAVKIHSNFLELHQDMLQHSIALEFAIHQHFEKNGYPLKSKPGLASTNKNHPLSLFDVLAELKSSMFTETDLHEMFDYIRREDKFVSVKENCITTFKAYILSQYSKQLSPGICQFCEEEFLNSQTKSRHIVGRSDTNKPPDCKIILMVNKLRQVDEYWEERKFELVNYQNKTMLIHGWNDLFDKLEESNEVLNKVIESEHCDERFEKDIVELEDKLYYIGTLFDLWNEVQHKWIYLEDLFSGSADISTLLLMESNRFFGVSNEFLALMDRIVKSPQILDVLDMIELEDAKNLLKQLVSIQEVIQKSNIHVEL